MIISDFPWMQGVHHDGYRFFSYPIRRILDSKQTLSAVQIEASSLLVVTETHFLPDSATLNEVCDVLISQHVLALFFEAGICRMVPWLEEFVRNYRNPDLILLVLPEEESYESVLLFQRSFEASLLSDPAMIAYETELKEFTSGEYTVLDIQTLLTRHLHFAVDITSGKNFQPFVRHNSLGILNLTGMLRERQYDVFSAHDFYMTLIGGVVVYIFTIDCQKNGPGVLMLHGRQERPISSRDLLMVQKAIPFISMGISCTTMTATLSNVTKQSLYLSILREENVDNPLQIRALAVAGGMEYRMTRHVISIEYTGHDPQYFQHACCTAPAAFSMATADLSHRVLIIEETRPFGKSTLTDYLNAMIAHISADTGESSFKISVSRPCHDLADISRAFQEAKFAMIIGRNLDPQSIVYWYRDYMDYHLICSIWSNSLMKNFYRSTIQELKKYNNRSGGCLLETLDMLTRLDFNINEVAEAMSLHRNTIYKRVERIDELVGYFKDNPSKKLLMQIAAKMEKISQIYDITEDSFAWNF